MPTETPTKPKDTKTKKEKTELEELDEQVSLLETVPLSVTRTLTNPDTEEEHEFVQKELGFLTKIKFTRLLAGTLRLADEEEKDSILDEFSDASEEGSYLTFILRAVELAPDFLEEAFILILKVSPEDQVWFSRALDEITDEEGIEIIDTFIAQNGKALRDFFDKHLKKLQARVKEEININLETE